MADSFRRETASEVIGAPDDTLLCPVCGRAFSIEAGITRFLAAKENDLCPLQKSEMEVRDKEYQAGFSAEVDAAYAPEFDAVRTALGDCRGLSVVDAGCGVGKFNRAVRNADLFLGIDFSWEGLLRFQKPNCDCTRLVQGDVSRMPLQDHTFDVALSCQVLSHLPTSELRAQYLSELARVLKPGGRLVLTAMHYSFRYRRRGILRKPLTTVRSTIGLKSRNYTICFRNTSRFVHFTAIGSICRRLIGCSWR